MTAPHEVSQAVLSAALDSWQAACMANATNEEAMHRVLSAAFEQLLTDAEREAIFLAGQLAGRLRRIIDAGGPNRDGDWAEVVHHIHGIQNMLMAQAAARAFPADFRRLGERGGSGE